MKKIRHYIAAILLWLAVKVDKSVVDEFVRFAVQNIPQETAPEVTA